MAEQKELINKLKEAIAANNIIIGSKQTVKHLKLKDLKLVVVANNCPEDIKKDAEKYAGQADIKIETFDGTAKQLGIICGKPFPIAVLSIK